MAPAIINFIYGFASRRENTLLVIKTDGIGDYILFRNYLQFLKTADKYKNYKIYLLTNTANKDLATNLDKAFINGFYWYADSFFLKWKLITLLYRLQQLRVSEILYPNYSRRYPVDWLVKNIRANKKTGINGDTLNESPLLKEKADKYYTQLLEPGKINLHEFERNKEIFEAFTSQKCSYVKPFMEKTPLNIKANNSIVIFPGGSENSKRWPPENFNELCKLLTQEFKTHITVIGGKDELAIGAIICNDISSKYISNKTGALTLTELSAVIGCAKLLISNDSMAVHVAVALDIPVVCISKGDLYGRFVPYPTSVYNKLQNISPASFTIKEGISNGEWSTSKIDEIPVDDVFYVVKQQLTNLLTEN